MIEKDLIRFWDKVEKTNECWNWIAGTRQGYGCFKYNGKSIDSHRISWLIHFGNIPFKMCVCHYCDNRLCVRPDHFFLGTTKDNMMDATLKGRIKPINKKYFTKEDRHKANKKIWLEQWHRRGKWMREKRRYLADNSRVE